jgi:hypothetical protein
MKLLRHAAGALVALFALSLAVATPASAFKLSQTAGGEMIEALGALANGGTMVIYDGTQPTDPDTAISTQNACATFTFNSTAFGSASHVSSSMQISASLAASTVTASHDCTPATFARVFDSSSDPVADMTVGTSGSDVNINSTSITSGGNVTVSSFAWAEPLQ